jgi:hypothetical protein
MLESYPSYDAHFLNKKAVESLDILNAMIKDIRNYKAAHSLAPNAKVKLVVSPKEPFKGSGEYLSRFAFASSYVVSKEALKGSPFLYSGCELVVEEDIDPAELKAKLLAEEKSLAFEVERGEKILGNAGFLAKAPKEKVEAEQEKALKEQIFARCRRRKAESALTFRAENEISLYILGVEVIFMEGKELSLSERLSILPGEALAFAAVMTVIMISVMAVVVYKLLRSKDGGVKLPGGWAFNWQ